MVNQILAEAIAKLNTMTVQELKKEGASIDMIISIRDELIAIKKNYEDYKRGKVT